MSKGKNFKKDINIAQRHITGLLALRRLFGGLGSEKPQSALSAFVRFCLRQILGALETQRRVEWIAFAFPYSGT